MPAMGGNLHLGLWPGGGGISDMRMPLTLSFAALLILSSPAVPKSSDQLTEESVRAAEQQRLQALVEGNIKDAERLHALDFQVLNPRGRVSKSEYLARVASKENDYLS